MTTIAEVLAEAHKNTRINRENFARRSALEEILDGPVLADSVNSSA